MDHLQQKKKWKRRLRKRLGIRRRIKASAAGKPRLSVYRSHKHISAQVIDDAGGRTLASASSQEPALAGALQGKKKAERAELVGKTVADRAKAAGVEKVVFDRGHYVFHGRVKALAEAARGQGLKF
ncbi:MAG TPA: 50S ribosomal protein L18 [Planctomycetota bacterium]